MEVLEAAEAMEFTEAVAFLANFGFHVVYICI
jgi:hypothetical protein